MSIPVTIYPFIYAFTTKGTKETNERIFIAGRIKRSGYGKLQCRFHSI